MIAAETSMSMQMITIVICNFKYNPLNLCQLMGNFLVGFGGVLSLSSCTFFNTRSLEAKDTTKQGRISLTRRD